MKVAVRHHSLVGCIVTGEIDNYLHEGDDIYCIINGIPYCVEEVFDYAISQIMVIK